MSCTAGRGDRTVHFLPIENPDPSGHLIRSCSAVPPDMDGIAPAPASAGPSRQHVGRTLSGAGATGLTAAGTVLLFLYLAGRFVWVYNKEVAAAAAANASAARVDPATPVHVVVVVPQPLHRAAPLPVFVRGEEGHGGSPDECAVCLSEFGQREAGRLLPGCGHGFHEACIVTWLRLSSTCPICRAAVAAPD
uniref:RING-type domain-containing protein n=1 Tax=Hordeum vulgare subsp. vulgare TaxID=112509 RepID=A0A8I6WAD3_HORVV